MLLIDIAIHNCYLCNFTSFHAISRHIAFKFQWIDFRSNFAVLWTFWLFSSKSNIYVSFCVTNCVCSKKIQHFRVLINDYLSTEKTLVYIFIYRLSVSFSVLLISGWLKKWRGIKTEKNPPPKWNFKFEF